METRLVNGRVFTGEQTLDQHSVILDGSEIVDVVPDNTLPARDHVVDLQGNTLVPGLIDLQVNGGGGLLFNDDPSRETITRITDAHRKKGTPAILPTLISDSMPKIESAITAVSDAIEHSPGSVVGIHLEGPFLSPSRKGVHNSDFFCRPDDTAIQMMGSLKSGRTLLTLAPEQTSTDVIRRFVDAGVVVAAGHSAATYDQIREALDAGLSGFTHLYNAMSPLGSREPGVVGAALDDEHSWCGIIADGVHVHWATLRLALSAKPRGKVFLVSDAMPPVGSPIKKFKLGGQMVSIETGTCRTSDGTLAGSTLDLMTAVRNAEYHLDVSREEAIRMGSLYPARFLGLGDRYGKIERGFKANMVLIDRDFNVVNSWVHGVIDS